MLEKGNTKIKNTTCVKNVQQSQEEKWYYNLRNRSVCFLSFLIDNVSANCQKRGVVTEAVHSKETGEIISQEGV